MEDRLGLKVRFQILERVAGKVGATSEDALDFFLETIKKNHKDFMDELDGWVGERRNGR